MRPTAEVATCKQLDGQQHEGVHCYERLSVDACGRCEYPLLWCEWCNDSASCCACGLFHSVDCHAR